MSGEEQQQGEQGGEGSEAAVFTPSKEVVAAAQLAIEGKYEKSLMEMKVIVQKEDTEKNRVIIQALEDRIAAQKALREEIKTVKFPLSDRGKTVQLKDGRKLGYEVFGANSKEGENQEVRRIVILMPGTPGCRLFCTEGMELAAKSRGIKLFVLERPGFGLSTPKSDRTILSFGEDVKEFIGLINTAEAKDPKVSVVGYSAGGPFAAVCGHACPELVNAVALISSPSPPEAPNVTQGMTFMNKIGYFLASHWKWGLSLAVGSEASAFVQDPIKKLTEVMTASIGDGEDYLSNPEIEKAFVYSSLEMYLTPNNVGVQAEVEDYYLFSHPWGFDLTKIDKSVKHFVWYGKEDVSVVPAMGEYLGKILPNVVVNEAPEKGHLLFFRVWEQVLDQLL